MSLRSCCHASVPPSPNSVVRGLLGAIGVALAVFAGAASALETESPEGRWQTYDPHTHAPRGIIRIFQKDGKMFGRIEHDGDRSLCRKCSDERKDQPFDGLVIIRNMQRAAGDPHGWEGGDVLDPDTGRTYRLTMHLDEHGATLVVHGYIGVSLIGRSQTWARAPD